MTNTTCYGGFDNHGESEKTIATQTDHLEREKPRLPRRNTMSAKGQGYSDGTSWARKANAVLTNTVKANRTGDLHKLRTNYQRRFIMKKAYVKPEIEIIEFGKDEEIVTEDGKLGASGTDPWLTENDDPVALPDATTIEPE